MSDLDLLLAAEVFFDDDADLPDEDRWIAGRHMLNLNDTFGWACADTEEVMPEEIPAVARLFRLYGMCGVYYWVAVKRGCETCEFKDVNRFMDFVRREEAQVEREPNGNRRAYMDLP